jgi:acetoin utilization deacetylase AcuC-like enzyme
MRDGTMSPEEIAQLELPWSREMVDAFRMMVGGTIQAARFASGLEVRSRKSEVRSSNLRLQTSDFSVVCHIGGGLHHAFPNHGEGFCPFNDVAVAVRDVQSRGLERAAIIDLDVHHGNGTAFIFEPRGDEALRREDDVPNVFTFSMHQQHNYPIWKPRGSLDIGLPDGAGDSRFLRELEQALPVVMESDPQCVFYLAGADPYEDDQLGGLRLTREGLRERDRMVIETVTARRVPLVITLAGGYARHVEDTVAIHAATIEEAKNAATKTRKHEKP